MSTLTITPNFDKKTAKIVGRIAAGEHVAVTLENCAALLTSTLRLRVLFFKRNVARFPMPVDEGEAQEEFTIDDENLTCELNLNTIQMLKAMRRAPMMEMMFVLDDTASDVKQLYFIAPHTIQGWPQEQGEDVPVDLDGYVDFIDECDSRIDAIQESVASDIANLTADMNKKVDKVAGKGLSTYDLTQDLVDSFAKTVDFDNHLKNAAALTEQVDFVKEDIQKLYDKKADLGDDGKIPMDQLPSAVDDVLEYATKSSFPTTGESSKIYIEKGTNKIYRWNGASYIELTPKLTIGTTEGTAYDGASGAANSDAINANAEDIAKHAESITELNNKIETVDDAKRDKMDLDVYFRVLELRLLVQIGDEATLRKIYMQSNDGESFTAVLPLLDENQTKPNNVSISCDYRMDTGEVGIITISAESYYAPEDVYKSVNVTYDSKEVLSALNEGLDNSAPITMEFYLNDGTLLSAQLYVCGKFTGQKKRLLADSLIKKSEVKTNIVKNVNNVNIEEYGLVVTNYNDVATTYENGDIYYSYPVVNSIGKSISTFATYELPKKEKDGTYTLATTDDIDSAKTDINASMRSKDDLAVYVKSLKFVITEYNGDAFDPPLEMTKTNTSLGWMYKYDDLPIIRDQERGNGLRLYYTTDATNGKLDSITRIRCRYLNQSTSSFEYSEATIPDSIVENLNSGEEVTLTLEFNYDEETKLEATITIKCSYDDGIEETTDTLVKTSELSNYVNKVTNLDKLNDKYTLKDIKNKVNEIIAILKGEA